MKLHLVYCMHASFQLTTVLFHCLSVPLSSAALISSAYISNLPVPLVLRLLYTVHLSSSHANCCQLEFENIDTVRLFEVFLSDELLYGPKFAGQELAEDHHYNEIDNFEVL